MIIIARDSTAGACGVVVRAASWACRFNLCRLFRFLVRWSPAPGATSVGVATDTTLTTSIVSSESEEEEEEEELDDDDKEDDDGERARRGD